jgi:hypothetical protein
MSKLVRVATFSDRMSAENAKNVLEASGIEAMLSSDDAGGLRPELTLARGVKLWVNEEDEEKARAALHETECAPDVLGETEAREEPRGFLTRLRKWVRGN